MSQTSALRKANVMRESLLDHGVPQVNIMLVAGRPASDRWDTGGSFRGAMSHHVASKPTVARPTPGLSLVRNGRADLSGPLANGHGGVNLCYNIITFGLANHPGTGGPLTLRGPLGNVTIPRDNARPYMWGTEWEGGYSEALWGTTFQNPVTKKKMTYSEFMGRSNNGIIQALHEIRGVNVADSLDLSGYHGEHKTWAPGRKPDRLGYTTDSGRAEMRRYEIKEPVKVGVFPTFRNHMAEELDIIEALNGPVAKADPAYHARLVARLSVVQKVIYSYGRAQWLALRAEYHAGKDRAYREHHGPLTKKRWGMLIGRLDLNLRRHPNP